MSKRDPEPISSNVDNSETPKRIKSEHSYETSVSRFGNVDFKADEQLRIELMLQHKLGKEDLSVRPGPRGSRLTYIESCKAIELANRAFGYNGWSCNIIEIKEEFRERRNDSRWSIGYSAWVRIVLKDGTFHEDIGFGQADGQRDLGAAIEQAKKACVSDARKRALRLFGEYLGNSCYDREHLKDVHSNRVNPTSRSPVNSTTKSSINTTPTIMDKKKELNSGGKPSNSFNGISGISSMQVQNASGIKKITNQGPRNEHHQRPTAPRIDNNKSFTHQSCPNSGPSSTTNVPNVEPRKNFQPMSTNNQSISGRNPRNVAMRGGLSNPISRNAVQAHGKTLEYDVCDLSYSQFEFTDTAT